MGIFSQIVVYQLLALSQVGTQKESISPFLAPDVIVVHAEVKSYSRSRDPDTWSKGNKVFVSNSCGYDTAVLEVKNVLLGTYPASEIAAHFSLGEWCEGLWQESIKEYVVYLRWNGSTWEAERDLSSPVINLNGGAWIMEPGLLEILRHGLAPVTETLAVPAKLKVALSRERLIQVGIEPDDGVSWKEVVTESASRCETPNHCWSSAPMFYGPAISLKALTSWLSSNYAIKPIAEQALRPN
jgi:hypothetical protein